MDFKNYLREYGLIAGFDFNEQQLTQFDTYYKMLVEKNRVMNLTAITEPKDVSLKHMLDSLFAYEAGFFTEGMRVCDVGTGAGFPGIPLKIMHSGLRVTLMDALGKRLKFLEDVTAALGLSEIVTCHIRAEDAGRALLHRNKYDVVIARAVARLNILAEYCLPLVKPGGVFAAMKAAEYAQEVQEAERAIQILGGRIVKIKEVSLPELADKRVVIYIKKEKTTPNTYPRRAGTPEKNPL